MGYSCIKPGKPRVHQVPLGANDIIINVYQWSLFPGASLILPALDGFSDSNESREEYRNTGE